MKIEEVSEKDALVAGDDTRDEVLDVHAVILNNYIRQHHVDSYLELAKRVRRLTILLSVEMEPDRDWDAQWSGLDVRVQKNWMFTTQWKHSAGFKESNFIHIPIDTSGQLKELKPDIIFSYEMGMRTLLSGWFRRFNRDTPLVMVGNMSQAIEQERGFLRRMLRKLICKSVDFFTYNGPSCKRYLQSLKIAEDRLFHVPYCIDETAVYQGPRKMPATSVRRMLYCGAISQRKGVVDFARALKQWCESNPDSSIEFSIAGSGELVDEVKACGTENLSFQFLGNCDTDALRDAYRATDICVYPSFADEWGLVPIEAMASGVPVLGSILAQSVESVVDYGRNGWSFDPTQVEQMVKAIDDAMGCTPEELVAMGAICRDSVEHISAAATADSFCKIVSKVCDPGLIASEAEKAGTDER